MVFTIIRIIQRLILPPGGPLLIMATGFLIARKKRMTGGVLIAAGFLLLYGLSIGPVSTALVYPLEKKYPPKKSVPGAVSAIVVLSGGVHDLAWAGLDPAPTGESLKRTVKGIMLYRKLHVPLVFVGGSGDPAKPVIGEAAAMARTATDLGVPGKDIVVEGTARNTLESARSLKARFGHTRIVLVTSAIHMRRAAAMFKKEGFDAVPAPCAYKTEMRLLSFYSFIPGMCALDASTAALSEYISYAWYAVKGDL